MRTLPFDPLLAAIAFPLASALVIACGLPKRWSVRLAYVAFAVPLLLALHTWWHFDASPKVAGYAFLTQYSTGLDAVGISLKLGLNGIAMPLFLLAGLVGFAAGLYALQSQAERLKLYLLLLLVMQGGLMGVFASVDVLFLYFFHELALIPTFIMVGVWGGRDRAYAAMKLTIYLTLGAMLSLAGLIAIYARSGANSFDLMALRDHLARFPLDQALQGNLFGLLLVGLGVLVSLFPLHTWAPLGYGAAPSSNAMLHAGVLKKFGLYTLIQVALPLLPSGHAVWASPLAWLAVLGNVLIIGFVTLAQRDLKQMIGYSSVMHMGYAFLGIATGTAVGVGGAVFLMVAHGLSVALLFLLATSVHHRTQTFALDEMGGLARPAPVLAAFLAAATFAGIGLPGFANFWGELAVFVALWQFSPAVTAVAVAGVVISAIYGLRALAQVCFGPATPRMEEVAARHPPADLRWSERVPALVLLTALLALGFWPRAISDPIHAALTAPAAAAAAPFRAMTLEAAKLAAANNLWGAILPELMLAGVALLLLALEILLPRRQHAVLADLAGAGILGTLLGLCFNWDSGMLGSETFGGLLYHSTSGQLLRAFFLIAAFLTCVIARLTLARQKMPRVEFYHLLLICTAAMMLLAQTNHLLMLFVTLETLTIALYVLVSYHRTSPASLEAGLKYVLMGALSSGLLLFGITLLYGVAGNPSLAGHAARPFHYADLAAFLTANPNHFLASLGIVLVLAGVAFKIGAFPFQIWVPDVYQGAPTPVTAFLAVASKAAGFAVLLGLCGPGAVFSSYAWLTTPVLTAMAAASLLFGNLAALTQHNVKRLLGLSGVSHAGFLLLGVVAAGATPMALGAIYFYLFAYLLAAFAVFGVMAHVAGPDDADQELDHYAGLAKESPFLAGVLTVGLGSLAGIPPLAGFMGKLFIFLAAFQAGARAMLAVAIVGVVVSIYYYFGWIRAAYFETWTPPADAAAGPTRPARTPVGLLAGVTLGVLALASVVIGFYPGPLGHWLAMR